MKTRSVLSLLTVVAAACLACESPATSSDVTQPASPAPSSLLAGAAPSRATPEEIARFAFTPTSFRAEMAGKSVTVRLERIGNELIGSVLEGTSQRGLTGRVDESGEVSLVDAQGRIFTGLLEGDGLSGAGPHGEPFSLQARFRDVPAPLALSPRLSVVAHVTHFRTPGSSAVLIRPTLSGEAAHLDDVNIALAAKGRTDASPLAAQLDEPTVARVDPEAAPEEIDVSYEVRPLTTTAFSLAETSYVYAGGAHGLSGLACSVVDAATGEIASGRSLLDARRVAELGELLTKRLRAENDGVALTAAGFFEDAVVVSEATAVCPTEEGVRFVFQTYEIAPYAFGRPEITLSRREAARFFAPSALAKTFLR